MGHPPWAVLIGAGSHTGRLHRHEQVSTPRLPTPRAAPPLGGVGWPMVGGKGVVTVRRGHPGTWCSKYRRPVLAGPIADRCGRLITSKCAQRDWQLMGVADRLNHHLPPLRPCDVDDQLPGVVWPPWALKVMGVEDARSGYHRPGAPTTPREHHSDSGVFPEAGDSPVSAHPTAAPPSNEWRSTRQELPRRGRDEDGRRPLRSRPPWPGRPPSLVRADHPPQAGCGRAALPTRRGWSLCQRHATVFIPIDHSMSLGS